MGKTMPFKGCSWKKDKKMREKSNAINTFYIRYNHMLKSFDRQQESVKLNKDMGIAKEAFQEVKSIRELSAPFIQQHEPRQGESRKRHALSSFI